MPSVKAGRYQLQEELGRGAMGVVWKAFDPTIGRTVAVKTMRLTEEDSGLSRAELISRFQNETRAAGLLSHPNIVVVYDAGEDEGTFYITMEYVAGRSLLSVIEQKQAFPVLRVIKVMEQACAALEYAHQRSVVHRDVKPANILLAPDDTVKITDFGTAKIIQMGTTQTGTIVGTPSYMSPEQIKGKPVDGRADVFSLGVILYELATGEKPFPGQNVTIYKIVHEDPISPRELDSSVHPGLSQVIAKALAKDPANRYQSCRALIEDLKNYRQLGGELELGATVVVSKVRTPPPSIPAEGTIIAPPYSPLPPAAAAPPVPSLRDVPADSGPPAPPVKAPPPPQAQPPARPVAAAPPRAAASAPRQVRLVVEEPQEKRSGMIWLVLLLLFIVAGGGYLMWPTLRARFNLGGATTPPTVSQPSAAAEAPEASAKTAEKSPGRKAAETVAAEAAAPLKKEEPAPVAAAKTEVSRPATTGPAEMKSQIEAKLAQAGVSDRVRVEVRGKTLALVGTLTPSERRRLMQLIRGPDGIRGGAGLKLEDRIQLARTAPGEEEEKPRTAPGLGEIEVVTDVLGATAAIKGPGGSPSADCKTPCRFEELPPGRYTMDVTLAGHRPVKRILNVRAGNIVEENLQLQALTSQIDLTSRPDRATIFINGQRYGETTPARIVLPPGNYAVALEKTGYERHEVTVPLRSDELKRVTVDLIEARPAARGGAPPPAAVPAPAPTSPPRPATTGKGWLDVRSIPRGADILFGTTNTGLRTPTRIELAAGEYTVVIYVKGYQTVRKTVTIQEGQTVTINEVLQRQP